MDLGFVTHATHSNSRLVYLQSVLSVDKTTLTVTGPPDGNVYPPGPGWLYLVVGNTSTVSKGIKVMVGDGADPPFDEGALHKCVRLLFNWYTRRLIEHAACCLRQLSINTRRTSIAWATMMRNSLFAPIAIEPKMLG